MVKKLLKFSPVVLFAGILFVGWVHRFWLFDSYRLMFYEPSARIEELAELSGMSDTGERYFYGAQPVLLLEESFDQECQFAELGLVLGCYKNADIFILDVVDDSLEPVEPVTAAHEMLHVVYSRLNQGEEERMEALLDEQFTLVTNERVLSEIDGYRSDPNADLYNEMHSIFGTELNDVLPELEEHYAQYFDDRSKVVAQSNAYESVFNELEKQIEKFDEQLQALGAQIDQLEADIERQGSRIVADRARLDALLAADSVSAYNAAVPGFNSLVNTHNANVELVESLVDDYNAIVAERNENVAAKNNLINSLDSGVEAIE